MLERDDQSNRLKSSYTDWMDTEIRFRLGLYVADGRDLPSELENMIELEPDQRLVDLGCGAGRMLLSLASSSPDSAQLIGIDNQILQLQFAKAESQLHGIENTEYLVSDMDQLSIPDNSVDIVLASYSLYLTDLSKSLEEIKRILKPDGTAYISTSSIYHKEKMRGAERIALNLAGLTHPGEQNSMFPVEFARVLLPYVFSECEEYYPPQETQIEIYNDERVEDYLQALYTVNTRVFPEPNDRQLRAFRRIIWGPLNGSSIKESILRDIERYGKFTDPYIRSIFICKP